MPYTLTWEHKAVVVQFYGGVTGAEFAGAHISIASDERYDGLRYMLLDYRGATSFKATAAQLDEIAALAYAASLSNGQMMEAHVAERVDFLGLVRHLVAANDSSHEQGIFRTVEAARAWFVAAGRRR